MSQITIIDQVKEALDQFNRVCNERRKVHNKLFRLFRVRNIYIMF